MVTVGDADSSSQLGGINDADVRDGEYDTYWSPDSPVPDGTLVNEQYIAIEWSGEPQSFDAVILREDGNLVREWRLETAEAQVLATGRSIGPSYYIEFPTVTSERVSLVIVEASALPKIAELEVYASQ